MDADLPRSSDQWQPFDGGATCGQPGSESGVILRDEEHSAGARITLERDAQHAPFAITCGIYGAFLHTTFAGSDPEAHARYEAMRARLAELATREGDLYEELSAFTEQFP